jgi:hypothetical protein
LDLPFGKKDKETVSLLLLELHSDLIQC